MRVCRQAVIVTVVVVLGIAANVAMAQPPQTARRRDPLSSRRSTWSRSTSTSWTNPGIPFRD